VVALALLHEARQFLPPPRAAAARAAAAAVGREAVAYVGAVAAGEDMLG
jgi:hypothetical protein